MLSNLWNQFTQPEREDSDEESAGFTPRRTEDEIAAASMLTTFPAYGTATSRRKPTLESTSPTNNLNNAPTVSSLVAGDWDISPSMRRRKGADGINAVAGLFNFDDLVLSGDETDDKSINSTMSAPSVPVKKSHMIQNENKAENIPWSDDELNLWRDSSLKKKKKKSSRHAFHSHQKDEMSVLDSSDDIRKQWIYHGSSNKINTMSADNQQLALKKMERKAIHTAYDDEDSDSASSDDGKEEEKLDEKSLWMPDQLCKKCYACEAQFTVFRRRHHCRLCGQVFCSRCSSFFVEIVNGKINTQTGQSEQNNIRTIRTCKVCYQQVSEVGPKGLSFQNNAGHETKSKTNEIVKQDGSGIRNFFVGAEDKISDSFQGGSSTDFLNLELVKQKLEEDRRRRACGDANISEEEHVKELTKSKTPNSLLQRRFGRLAEAAAREVSVGDTGFNDDETKLVGTGVRNIDIDEMAEYEKETSKDLNASEKRGVILPHADDSSVATSLDTQKQFAEEIKHANRHLQMTAADYLEKMGKELMKSDAPLLLKELGIADVLDPKFEKWVSKLMTLATKCCKSVQVDIKKGDALDIRPYCKVKAISGGLLKESAFFSGVMFTKNVSHKSMTREIKNPRIMLLSGGIDYTRADHKIASLNTLLEQEDKYLQILVAKITKLKPDVLLVGKAVSRKAQELLLEKKIVLLQHVKPSLMDRIARQTGAVVLSSTDHVMNQFGSSVLGYCRRFRLVSFRDNDIWSNKENNETQSSEYGKVCSLINNIDSKSDVENILSNSDLSHSQRQAILAAHLLGEKVHDGGEAVRSGIQKRGVTQTYVMIEGCPSHLGCTVILRGASRPALKQVKRILKFLINVAYNLRLETKYLIGRRAVLPQNYKLPLTPTMSSSLCVDYGAAPNQNRAPNQSSNQNRKQVRPWNPGNLDPITIRSLSGKINALEHQSILMTSIWMAGKTQCCPAEVKGISYYSQQDVSLGQFLRDSCFNLTLKCQNPNCKKSVLEHTLSFVHNDGMINISVQEADVPKQDVPSLENGDTGERKEQSDEIVTWTYCVNCKRVVTPLSKIDNDTWKYSFGKFLEVSFYNKSLSCNSPDYGCNCSLQENSVLFFGCGNLAARFSYDRIKPYSVYLRRHLPFDDASHKRSIVKQLNEIMVASPDLFERFNKKIEEVKSATKELFVNAVNSPEHLQTILSELNSISKEVDHASKTLRNKIVAVTNSYNAFNKDAESGYSYGEVNRTAQDAFSHCPWQARRYVFLVSTAWNERLSAVAQAVTSMKKVVIVSQKLSIGIRSDIGVPQGVGADGELDEVHESMQRLKELKEIYKGFNVFGDIDFQSSFNVMPDIRKDDNDDNEDDDDIQGNTEDDLEINFSEEIDADVMASRMRRTAVQVSDQNSSRKSTSRPRNRPPSQRMRENGQKSSQIPQRDSFTSISSRSPSPSPQQKARAVSAGGAVKSAINRFFNRGGKDDDDRIVDLGMFREGRVRLDTGVGGVVIPVYDEKPSTIIAHSLASIEYENLFRRHTRNYLKESGIYKRNNVPDGDELEAGIEVKGGSYDQSSRSKKYDSRSSRRGRSELRKNTEKISISSNTSNAKIDVEKRMLGRNKSHIKHTFRDYDEKGNQIAKYVVSTFWATQFQAVRQSYLKEPGSEKSPGFTYSKNIVEKNFVKSLSTSESFAAVGGKSGASFSRTDDDRFIVKSISRTELQMFLDCAPAYFEYLGKAFFHGLPTMLCKIVGVYQIGYHNRETGKKTMEQVAVMQNIFHGRNVSKVFDLKGSLKGRFAKNLRYNRDKAEARASTPSNTPSKRYGSDSDASSEDEAEYAMSYNVSDEEDNENKGEDSSPSSTLLDGDFLDFTLGRPLPLTDKAKASFHMSILNDTLFLSIINVLDYSILVGIDEEKNELIVGIIDFMRQYDILKQVERMGKSIPMMVGSEAPTIIQPPAYKARFVKSMERYFMTTPSKWTTIS